MTSAPADTSPITETGPTTDVIRRNWTRAAACSPALIAPSRYVAELMEFTLALAGPAMQQHYDAFRADPGGAALLAERPSLRDHLSDREALAAMPAGSFGRAYLDFTGRYRFDAAAFDQVHHLDEMGDRLGWDDDLTFVIARGLQMHDMWHTLGGYGPDWAGEAGVIHFTYGQVPFAGSGAIAAILAALPGGVPLGRWQRFLAQARRRGAQASNLMVAPYERLLPLPLAEVRRRLGISPPEIAHPGGIPYSTFQYGFGKQRDRAYDAYVQPHVAA